LEANLKETIRSEMEQFFQQKEKEQEEQFLSKQVKNIKEVGIIVMLAPLVFIAFFTFFEIFRAEVTTKQYLSFSLPLYAISCLMTYWISFISRIHPEKKAVLLIFPLLLSFIAILAAPVVFTFFIK
jgi:hypothetical protein